MAKSGYFMGLMDIFGKKWTFVWKSGFFRLKKDIFWDKWIFLEKVDIFYYLTCSPLIYFRLIFVFGMQNRTFGKWSRAKSKVSWIQFLVSAIVILVLLIKYLMRKR